MRPASTLSIAQLTGGETSPAEPLGQNMSGELVFGFIPDREIDYIPQMQLGDGLAGPLNDQPLQIWRDNRVIATDELGMQGPFQGWRMVARRSAGRTFPLNYEFSAGIDPSNPGRLPTQQTMAPSVFPLGWEEGFQPVEVLPNPNTVFYTANPATGWQGY